MTLVLVVMSALSLVYVFRGVDEEAKEDSLKAREAVYGNLVVTNSKNVGYEWDYRSYITGAANDEEAIWTFPHVPRQLADRKDTVRCEFSFDIFRTTKGEENQGIFTTFVFENWQWKPQRLGDFNREANELRANPDPEVMARARRENWPPEKTLAVLFGPLAEKYGYYELPSKEVVDFHTLFVEVPAGLFHSLGEWTPGQRPPLKVTVRCDSPTQYLGVAKHDLYLLASENTGADLMGFGMNFFKGAMGLWFKLCLVIGLAVTCSTYLSGVISFLAVMVLYGLGMILDFIQQLAQGKTIGGGSMENLIRLATGAHPVTPLDQTPALKVALGLDKVHQFVMGVVLNVIPDVDRFDLTQHVAEGFNIGGVQLAMTGVLLVGYLLPWLVLAFYLIRSREVAA
jgi:hypothetical protein